MSFIARYVCTYEEFVIVTEAPTVQQKDSDRTGHRQQKNNIQIYNLQNSRNTIYNTDNYVCGQV